MNRAQGDVLRRLAELGGWTSRAALAADLQWTEQRVDDELADLVVEGNVLFNGRGCEYRLGGTPLARRAMQRLTTGDPARKRVVLASPPRVERGAPQVMRVGIASAARCFNGGELLVMTEIEMPYQPADPAAVQRMVHAVLGLMGPPDAPAGQQATAKGQRA